MQAPGKTFLKVTGIIYIVIAGFCILGALALFAGGSVLAAAFSELGPEYAMAGGIIGGIGGAMSLILGALYLVTGILGVKNCNKPEKHMSCMVWGIIFVVILTLWLILFILSNAGALFIVGALLLLANGVLYLMGALKNKAAATMAAPKM